MTARSGPAAGRGRRHVRRFGDAALLVDVEGPDAARALVAAVEAAGRPEVREVVGGLASVLVECDLWSGPPLDLDRLAAWLGALATPAPAPGEAGSMEAAGHGPRTVTVPVAFGGPDTDDVCRAAGVRPSELAGLLQVVPLRVAAMGFSPGFAYLAGLPAPLVSVPRLDRPRPSVPGGSVALAGGLAAIYPQATPGGWRLVGRTGLRLFDPDRPPYALLRPGDRVRLRAVDPSTVPAGDDVGPAADAVRRAALRPPPGTVPALAVERPGLLSLVQDRRRWGLAALGVPGAGPADPVAHQLANRLVGNDAGAGAVEVTASGPAVRALAALHVAAVGDVEVRIDGHPVRSGHVLPLGAGQRIELGSVVGGARAYLAVAGGIEVPAVLGSRSTDVLTWLGPGALRAGDVLGAGRARAGPPADHLVPAAVAALRATVGQALPATGGGPVPGHPAAGGAGPFHLVLRVVAGPHAEWFAPGALEHLAAVRFTVGPASDRVGLRLVATGASAGDSGLGRRPGELASHGVVTGAVQVPPGGAPVVLGPDHATLGGYPVLAVVVVADRWAIGQCRPGDTVSLAPVTFDAAAAALARLRRLVGGAVAGTYPVTAG